MIIESKRRGGQDILLQYSLQNVNDCANTVKYQKLVFQNGI